MKITVRLAHFGFFRLCPSHPALRVRASTFKRIFFFSDRQLLVSGDLRTLARILSPRRQSLCDRPRIYLTRHEPRTGNLRPVARSLYGRERYTHCRLLGIDGGPPCGYHCLLTLSCIFLPLRLPHSMVHLVSTVAAANVVDVAASLEPTVAAAAERSCTSF